MASCYRATPRPSTKYRPTFVPTPFHARKVTLSPLVAWFVLRCGHNVRPVHSGQVESAASCLVPGLLRPRLRAPGGVCHAGQRRACPVGWHAWRRRRGAALRPRIRRVPARVVCIPLWTTRGTVTLCDCWSSSETAPKGPRTACTSFNAVRRNPAYQSFASSTRRSHSW
jgi:hypothetical protein